MAWAAVIAPTLEETPLTHLGEAQGKIVHMPLFAAVPVILHLSYRGLYIKQLCRYKRAVSQPQIQPPGSHNQGASTPISPFPGFVFLNDVSSSRPWLSSLTPYRFIRNCPLHSRCQEKSHTPVRTL